MFAFIDWEMFCLLLVGNVGDFGVMPIHTKPDDAEKEISELVKAYDAYKEATNVSGYKKYLP